MIISLEKEEDKKTLRDIGEITLQALQAYEMHKTDEWKEIAEYWNSAYDRLAKRIATHDYTKDDQTRRKVDKIIGYDKNSNRRICHN